jgi:hypothetical protein
MSDFNDANELASQLVYGRHYEGDEPCKKPTRIVFTRGSQERTVTAQQGLTEHDRWRFTANLIQSLLAEGFDAEAVSQKFDMKALEEYRALVGDQNCKCCAIAGRKTPLPREITHYAHSGGWRVKGFADLQWLYLECPCCESQESLWKLGVRRDAGDSDDLGNLIFKPGEENDEHP